MDKRTSFTTVFCSLAQPFWRQLRPRLAFTCVLVLTVLTPACAPSNSTSCSSDAEWIIDGFTLQNARFKIPFVENGLLPSDIFWFAAGDDQVSRRVVYGWDQSLMQLRDNEVGSCDYSAPGPGCRQCDYCTGVTGLCTDGASYGLAGPGNSYGSLFQKIDSTETLVADFTQPYYGCLNRPGNPTMPSFLVDGDATYTIRRTFFCGRQADLATLKTKLVIEPRTIREPMVRYVDNTDPVPRYRFQMPLLAGKLRENFSPNLRITQVRILLGRRDPVTTLLTVWDDPLALRKARPSRIMFLRSVLEGDINHSPTEGTDRCYFDATKDDGGFDLLNCRRDREGTNVVRFDATPTFLVSHPSETLTWVIEYKVDDGLAEFPTFETGEEPILELTIANP
ncbi:MAG: hypothetical protein ABIP75_16755 [Pyrinomonadaceae bacterium]